MNEIKTVGGWVVAVLVLAALIVAIGAGAYAALDADEPNASERP